jgi:hypothetical protein
MKEVWKDIEGYEGLYQVSNLGRVKSMDRIIERKNNTDQKRKGKMLESNKTQKQKDGLDYPSVGLCKFAKVKLIRVHRLVAETFIKNNDNNLIVNHINGIKTDNVVSNLEWVTQSDNLYHAYKMGLKDKYFNKNTKRNIKTGRYEKNI